MLAKSRKGQRSRPRLMASRRYRFVVFPFCEYCFLACLAWVLGFGNSDIIDSNFMAYLASLVFQERKSTLENCQVLQATVNRSKGNRTEISKADLIQKSSYCRVSGICRPVIPRMVDENDLGALLIGDNIIMASGLFLNSSVARDMDLLELSAYGNVRRGQDSKGCKIQRHLKGDN
ncbi:hypothetical protein ACSBR1_024663 [Camellia fascicularis]